MVYPHPLTPATHRHTQYTHTPTHILAFPRSLTADPDVCPSYPPSVIAPICTPEMDLIRGASLYCEGRFPTLTWIDQLTGAALLRAASTKEER